ncbi:hypothetical protein CD30_13735 [Ureibacillus massiliensis 4400831 = CIP 108448 = CCUG 49529]|uniref:Glycosyl transferase family 1 domain-containing protein n=1 Tax=Ureibacillus massiliensis 4400831 = CIP 108448 = CCUG 49529 TaxID=1211035 RepID=A0A0A3IZ33_9BACL|nr:glycosyltransferase family 4 protein [Ureibacillus massiliensis]KGR90034.1 hypothetical protein CD30_13735 [Ureibacillus massiliensis 4400831 = CIP 108448 = CCUG 49529]
MKNIAFVIQRYGEEIVGGSETYCRELAERLVNTYNVDILTTCAKSYESWKNEYPEGKTVENGVTVLRFRNDKKRNRLFGRYTKFLQKKKNKTVLDEVTWMNLQGPYSKNLLAYLENHQDNYDLIIFVTYLYFNSYYGLQIAPHKSVLIPTAHDEPPIYYSMFNTVFHLAQGHVFLTEEEKDFVFKRFPGLQSNYRVIGMGIDDQTKQLTATTEIDSKIEKAASEDYVVYVGRIDTEKNIGELVDYFNRFIKDTGSDLRLYLTGSLQMDIPKQKNISYLGFVSEQEKKYLLEHARAFIMPSRFESFSIATLEAMNFGAPVFVNKSCEVLNGHVERSQAGLSYRNYEEFKDGLQSMLTNTTLVENMRGNGKKYVSQHYEWDVIIKKYVEFIDECCQNTKR